MYIGKTRPTDHGHTTPQHLHITRTCCPTTCLRVIWIIQAGVTCNHLRNDFSGTISSSVTLRFKLIYFLRESHVYSSYVNTSGMNIVWPLSQRSPRVWEFHSWHQFTSSNFFMTSIINFGWVSLKSDTVSSSPDRTTRLFWQASPGHEWLPARCLQATIPAYHQNHLRYTLYTVTRKIKAKIKEPVFERAE